MAGQGGQVNGVGNGLSPHRSKVASFREIFTSSQEARMGWDLLELESMLYSQSNVHMENIQALIAAYSHIIYRLNGLSDPRESFFTHKMQKLMAEPYVIRAFNNKHTNTEAVYEHKRKELEQRLEKETERTNHHKVLEQALIAQNQKEEKMKSRIKEVLQDSEKRLSDRRKRRKEAIEMRNSMLSDEGLFGRKQTTPVSSKPIPRAFEMSADDFRLLKHELEEEERDEAITYRLSRDMGERDNFDFR